MRNLPALDPPIAVSGRREGCTPLLPAGWWMIPAALTGATVWAAILF